MRACSISEWPLSSFFFLPDGAEKQAAKDNFIKTDLPLWCGRMATLLKQNNGGQAFFVGSKLSLADICWFTTSFLLTERIGVKIDYPELKAHVDRFMQVPQMQTYYKNFVAAQQQQQQPVAPATTQAAAPVNK